MSASLSRRHFLERVGGGALLAALGPAAAVDLGLVAKAFGEDADTRLHFGPLEPLVCELQETPLAGLQPLLVRKVRSGTALKQLIAAAALANARTFGGEDYIGFHTFMAFAPALRMSALMPPGAEPLPVLKVLYRNNQRMHAVGARAHEVLHQVNSASADASDPPQDLYRLIRNKDAARAERLFASLVAKDPQAGLDALLPSVKDQPEVHRTVLPFRAWDMVNIVGEEHALTLLRQSLHYCLNRTSRDDQAAESEQARILVRLFDQFKLQDRGPGALPVSDDHFEELSSIFATGSGAEAAEAAASALSQGYAPAAIGEALSYAASRMVLLDGGRLPQYEEALKPPGCVHGDSVGVHASDAANAWRNLAQVSTGKNQLTCLIIGAWQIANDRAGAQGLMQTPLPSEYHLKEISATGQQDLLQLLDEAVRTNLQGHATAIVQRYAQLEHSPAAAFNLLLPYAVSEDGALHAEKYFQTTWDDFHATRASARWRHLMSLARVTASEYGKPAAGQAEARELLGIS